MRGMLARACSPRWSGSTGTSRQPSGLDALRAAGLLERARVPISSRRKTIASPPPGVRTQRVRERQQQARAVSRLAVGRDRAAVAHPAQALEQERRRSRARRGRRRSATKPMPQASRSVLGSWRCLGRPWSSPPVFGWQALRFAVANRRRREPGAPVSAQRPARALRRDGRGDCPRGPWWASLGTGWPRASLTTASDRATRSAPRAVAIFGEVGEDLVGGFHPDVGARVLVPVLEPGADVGFQVADASCGRRGAASLVVIFGEPALDEVEPGGALGDEVEPKRGWRSSQRWIVGVLWVA